MSLKQLAKNILPYGVVTARQQKRAATTPAPVPPVLPAKDGTPPAVYAADGTPMAVFYLQDSLTPDYPYSFVYGAMPKHLLWDRYNYGLKTHFYTHDNILRMVPGDDIRRFAYFIESEALLPQDYQLFAQHSGLAAQFERIFTHSITHLDKYENAVFCPAGGVWYGNSRYAGGTLSDTQCERKTKNLSIVASSKAFCPLHEARTRLAVRLAESGTADTFGTFCGGAHVPISETLAAYRFSIAVENNIAPFYFTEKLLNCFAAMTVPVYVGATDIGKFFNEDGIIHLRPEEMDSAEKVLAGCTEAEYLRRLPAIRDNYRRVQEYLTIEDWLMNHYGTLLRGEA